MRTGYIGKNRGITLSIFMFLILVLVCVVKVEDVDAAILRTGVINVGVSNVRKGPSTSYACIKHKSKNISLKLGQTVTITNENAKWYKVNFYYDEKAYTGYIIKSNIKIKIPTLYYKAKVNTNALNVRKADSTSSAKIKVSGNVVQLKKDQSVHIYKTTNDWYYVKYKYDNKYSYGYVAAKYVDKLTYTANTTAGGLYVRSGADTSKSIVQVNKKAVLLEKNTKVNILGIAGNWYYISVKFDGKTVKGYVYKDYVKNIKVVTKAVTPTVAPTKAPTPTAAPTKAPTPTVAPTKEPEATKAPTPTKDPNTASTDKDDNLNGKLAFTTASALNVREGAGTTYDVIMSGKNKVLLEKGTLINIISTKGEWYYISVVFDGKTIKGYVCSDYVTTLGVSSKGAYGIDVSQYQKDIDWKQVKASGVDFAIIRATRYSSKGENGTNLIKDSTFDTNMKNAIAAGVKVGVYVYSYADTKEQVVKEAELVCSYVKNYKVTYPIYFDIEEASRQKKSLRDENTNFAKAFCEMVKAKGYKAGVYTGAGFFENYLNVDELKDYDLWIARYIYTTSYKLPNNKDLLDAYVNKTYMHNLSTGAKDKFTGIVANMWQFSSTCKVNGISGQIDMNYIFKAY